MSLTIPASVSGALGGLTQVLSDYSILDSDMAGTVKSVFDAISGQGTGVPSTAQTTVPVQTTSPVSAEAKSSVQKPQLSTKTWLIIGGVAAVGLFLAFK